MKTEQTTPAASAARHTADYSYSVVKSIRGYDSFAMLMGGNFCIAEASIKELNHLSIICDKLNSHDDLLAALKLARQTGDFGTPNQEAGIKRILDAAISKAEGAK